MLNHLALRLTTLAGRTTPLALLAVRVVVGVVFLTSGWGKLHHLDGVMEFFRSLGIPWPELQAPFVAAVEFAGGALVLAGLATRLAALPLISTMVVAIATAKWGDLEGFGSFVRLSEVDYAVLFFVLFAFGAGPLSLDALLARRRSPSEAMPALQPV